MHPQKHQPKSTINNLDYNHTQPNLTDKTHKLLQTTLTNVQKHKHTLKPSQVQTKPNSITSKTNTLLSQA